MSAQKQLKLAVVMDPIEQIRHENDTTVHLLAAAQRKRFEVTYMSQQSLNIYNGEAFGSGIILDVCLPSLQEETNAKRENWYKKRTQQENIPLTHFDVILMRKDPPFNMDYIYSTYILEVAEKAGVLVLNKPQSLRDANEKLFAVHFPDCCPSTLISADKTRLHHFWKKEKNVVFKPLDGMGGHSIFIANENEPNINVIIETLTQNGTRPILVQQYLPEIHTTGDKRILLINGEPVPFALARFPAKGETRGNLAVGGKGVVVPLTERDYWLCQQISSTLKAKKLLFVGLDVIGNYITEINITSPTGLPAIERATSLDIAGQFIELIKNQLEKKND